MSRFGTQIFLATLLIGGVFVPQMARADSAPIDCTVSECAQRMVEIANKLMEANQALQKRLDEIEAAEKGMIAAFDAQTCPTSWTEYTNAKGRFFLAANGPGPDGQPASIGTIGGGWTVSLTTNNLPDFTSSLHGGFMQSPLTASSGGTWITTWNINEGALIHDHNGDGDVIFKGKHDAVVFAPPYISLLFCKRN